MGVDWILDVPEGKESIWMDYWHEISQEAVKGTGTGLFVRSDLSVRGDWAGPPSTKRFLAEYMSFLEDYSNCEAVRRLKLAEVSTVEDFAFLGKRVLPLVCEQVKRKEHLEPMGKTGLNLVHHTEQGAIWNELRTLLMRFFFALFAEMNNYPILEWK